MEKGEGGQRRVYHGAEPAAGIHRRPPPAAQAPAHLPSRLSHLPVSNLPSVWAFFDGWFSVKAIWRLPRCRVLLCPTIT